MPAFFPTLMVSYFAISGTGTPLSLSATAKVSMSSSMTLDRPPWLPLDAAMTWTSRVLPDVVALDLPGDGEHGEEHGAYAVGVVDPGERPGEEFELDAAGLELGG
ncbi:hypothetical protein, partial [Streptomyces sp. NPDC059753]|uniref:hypothetical protein n=1 Tax=Streptomyces sp. NPDC059753 TaxID=3346933 RepID=UPI003666C4FC